MLVVPLHYRIGRRCLRDFVKPGVPSAKRDASDGLAELALQETARVTLAPLTEGNTEPIVVQQTRRFYGILIGHRFGSWSSQSLCFCDPCLQASAKIERTQPCVGTVASQHMKITGGNLCSCFRSVGR